MENAECKNHANHNEYGMGSFNLGMGNAGSKWYAKLWGAWGAWGMLAWGMQGATPMPRMLARLMLLECWHRECYQHMVCQLYWHDSCYWNVGMGLATSIWYANYIGMGLAIWGGSPIGTTPATSKCCAKKSFHMVHFVLDASTKI